jgi:flagellar biosynthesis component FlhA
MGEEAPWQFKELNLFPRVIFATGALAFVIGLIHGNSFLALLGLSSVFFAVAYNFGFELYLNKAETRTTDRLTKEYKAMKLHLVLSILFALTLLVLAHLPHHHHGHHTTSAPTEDPHHPWF